MAENRIVLVTVTGKDSSIKHEVEDIALSTLELLDQKHPIDVVLTPNDLVSAHSVDIFLALLTDSDVENQNFKHLLKDLKDIAKKSARPKVIIYGIDDTLKSKRRSKNWSEFLDISGELGIFHSISVDEIHDKISLDMINEFGLTKDGHNMTIVADIMISDLITASSNDTVIDVVTKLVTNRIASCIIVSNTNVVLGIFTLTDAIWLIANKSGWEDKSVQEYMTTNVTTISPTDTIETAIETMARHRFSKLIVTQGQKAQGIITQADVIKWWYDKSQKAE